VYSAWLPDQNLILPLFELKFKLELDNDEVDENEALIEVWENEALIEVWENEALIEVWENEALIEVWENEEEGTVPEGCPSVVIDPLIINEPVTMGLSKIISVNYLLLNIH
jgi:hypothetical protein